ncbi:MAG: tRNA 2-selenouridine(34) synthase MnmH [Oligoflexia bacterium]|nr:tRNA 2-selenouridine(34) synthase MnmH [Oligoflexia bacterium]
MNELKSFPKERIAEIFTQNLPLIDVRAAVEFEKGGMPNACNLPLLNNKERELVGICYKERGPSAAILLGQQLVSGETLLDRQVKWARFIEENPNALLYCFRGGLRSKWAQTFIFEYTGREIARVEGGHKALRHFLLNTMVKESEERSFLILGGKTGAGKTELLLRHAYQIDIEGLAVHRGSAFGNRMTPQPSQVDFENALAVKLLQMRKGPSILLENESRVLGRISIPDALYCKMQNSPLIILNKSVEERARFIVQTYIVESYHYYLQKSDSGQDESSALEMVHQDLKQSLQKISRRLGGVRYQEILALLERATNSSKWEEYLPFVERLLVDYYDPYYDYAESKNSERIVFSGREEEILEYLTAS